MIGSGVSYLVNIITSIGSTIIIIIIISSSSISRISSRSSSSSRRRSSRSRRSRSRSRRSRSRSRRSRSRSRRSGSGSGSSSSSCSSGSSSSNSSSSGGGGGGSFWRFKTIVDIDGRCVVCGCKNAQYQPNVLPQLHPAGVHSSVHSVSSVFGAGPPSMQIIQAPRMVRRFDHLPSI